MFKFSIEKTIKDTARALRVGVHPNMAKWCLLAEGWEAKRASQILLWAQQMMKNSTSNKEVI
jgi:hypothetical protein